jgi:hypothetical protein
MLVKGQGVSVEILIDDETNILYSVSCLYGMGRHASGRPK